MCNFKPIKANNIYSSSNFSNFKTGMIFPLTTKATLKHLACPQIGMKDTPLALSISKSNQTVLLKGPTFIFMNKSCDFY